MSSIQTTTIDPAETRLIKRAAEVRLDDLSSATVDAALLAIFDTLGVAAGGLRSPVLEKLLASVAKLDAPDFPAATPVPWTSLHLPPADAVMVASALGHAWDFDETHDIALLHACVAVLPAALVAGWSTGASGARVIEGVVAGVEVACRIGLALGAPATLSRTGTCDVFGAAAAAARVLDLGPDGMRDAVSIAVSLAGSTRQLVTDSAPTKRLQPAFAARNGLLAAELASHGFAGPSGWLSGWAGLMAAAVPQEGWAERLDYDVATEWEVERLSLKPYPCDRETHPAIKAALTLYDEGVRRPREVTVHAPTSQNFLVARPWSTRGNPVIDAQFSIPWLVSAALIDGRIDLTTMGTDRVLAADIRELATRVTVVCDLEPTSKMTPAVVRAVAEDGTERTVTIEDAPGSPQAPMSWPEVVQKVEACVELGGHGPDGAQRLSDIVRTLPGRDRGAADLLTL